MSLGKRDVVRVVCPDTARCLVNRISSKGDIIVPVPGIYLGSSEDVKGGKFAFIPSIEDKLIVLEPHDPCLVVTDPSTAEKLGQVYADTLFGMSTRIISLFLGDHGVTLHDPSMGRDGDPAIQWLYTEACDAHRSRCNRMIEAYIAVKEIAVAPAFSLEELSDPRVLCISSVFLGKRGFEVIKKICNGILPKRNYDRAVESSTRDRIEAMCAA